MMPLYEYRCESCMYSHENGAKENCYGVVGLCRMSDGSPKWKPIDDDEGFDPDRYLPQPTVMSDEKDYMDFGEVV